MVRASSALASGALIAGLLVIPAAAADKWIEVRSAHFTVLSNASDGATRTLTWQLEQIRSTLKRSGRGRRWT